MMIVEAMAVEAEATIGISRFLVALRNDLKKKRVYSYRATRMI
jgi:hypothetical protein